MSSKPISPDPKLPASSPLGSPPDGLPTALGVGSVLVKKDAFYFPHDCNAQDDPKIMRMRRNLGWESYGIYWAVVERLYAQNGRLPSDFETLAFGLQASHDTVRAIVSDYDLFYFSGNEFGSTSVDRRINDRREKSIRGKEFADRGWVAKGYPQGTHTSGVRVPYAKKERKGKERKENKIKETTSADAPVGVGLTPIQIVVEAYKSEKGFGKDWDQENFSRATKAAKSLLGRFHGDVNSAANYISLQGRSLTEKNLTWTLETIQKHAWENIGPIPDGRPKSDPIQDRIKEIEYRQARFLDEAKKSGRI